MDSLAKMLPVGTKVRVKEISNPNMDIALDSIQNRLQGEVVTIADIKANFYLIKRLDFITAINRYVEIWNPVRFSEVEVVNED